MGIYVVFLLALRSPHGTWERPEYIKLTVRLAGDSGFRVELLELRGAINRQWEAQAAGGGVYASGRRRVTRRRSRGPLRDERSSGNAVAPGRTPSPERAACGAPTTYLIGIFEVLQRHFTPTGTAASVQNRKP